MDSTQPWPSRRLTSGGLRPHLLGEKVNRAELSFALGDQAPRNVLVEFADGYRVSLLNRGERIREIVPRGADVPDL